METSFQVSCVSHGIPSSLRIKESAWLPEASEKR